MVDVAERVVPQVDQGRREDADHNDGDQQRQHGRDAREAIAARHATKVEQRGYSRNPR